MKSISRVILLSTVGLLAYGQNNNVFAAADILYPVRHFGFHTHTFHTHDNPAKIPNIKPRRNNALMPVTVSPPVPPGHMLQIPIRWIAVITKNASVMLPATIAQTLLKTGGKRLLFKIQQVY